MIHEREVSAAVELYLESEYYRLRARERRAIRQAQQPPAPVNPDAVTWADIALVVLAGVLLMLLGANL